VNLLDHIRALPPGTNVLPSSDELDPVDFQLVQCVGAGLVVRKQAIQAPQHGEFGHGQAAQPVDAARQRYWGQRAFGLRCAY
jgi:hypothetical protein